MTALDPIPTLNQMPKACSASPSETVERDFREAIEAYGNAARADADRRVTRHPAILPWASAHGPRESRSEDDRHAARQADLPSMCVPGQQQIEPGRGGLSVYFRRMGQKD
jgi:hypothetical protein